MASEFGVGALNALGKSRAWIKASGFFVPMEVKYEPHKNVSGM